MSTITTERLSKYENITKEALKVAKESGNRLANSDDIRTDFLDMIERYVRDAKHFEEQGDIVNAFAALNYAHGWLDAGARIGLFDVNDSRLFTVDGKE